MMKTAMIWILSILLVLLFAATIFIYWANYIPERVEAVQVHSSFNRSIKISQPIKVMTWNVQFMAGNIKNHFYFDNGKDNWPSKKTIYQTITHVANVIKTQQPDIVMLQELQSHSKQTHYINQVNRLFQLIHKDYPNWACTYYWKTQFFPHYKVLGPVDMQLCVFTKYTIKRALRYALPSKLHYNFILQQFLPKRAVLKVNIPIANSTKSLVILTTHLSAYHRGVNTVYQQVDIAYRLLESINVAGGYGILAGDFNQLPNPKMRRYIYQPEQKLFNKNNTAIGMLLTNFQSAPSLADATGEDYQQWFTAMSTRHDINIPDRTIDYIFITDSLRFVNYAVLKEGALHISDHLPLIATISFNSENSQ